jgi:hypothetical protein
MVTVVQFHVIYAVRRQGSVTAAAKDLRYTQPSGGCLLLNCRRADTPAGTA